MPSSEWEPGQEGRDRETKKNLKWGEIGSSFAELAS
jgi:hypothetical protein